MRYYTQKVNQSKVHNAHTDYSTKQSPLTTSVVTFGKCCATGFHLEKKEIFEKMRELIGWICARLTV